MYIDLLSRFHSGFDLSCKYVQAVHLCAAVFAVGEVCCIILPYSRRSGSVLLPLSHIDSVLLMMCSGAERRLKWSSQRELKFSMSHIGHQRSCVELL
jgi:hypothetical protein